MATTQTAPKKGLINFDFAKLGKVLMTVIAVMPCGGSDDQSGQAGADGRR